MSNFYNFSVSTLVRLITKGLIGLGTLLAFSAVQASQSGPDGAWEKSTRASIYEQEDWDPLVVSPMAQALMGQKKMMPVIEKTASGIQAFMNCQSMAENERQMQKCLNKAEGVLMEHIQAINQISGLK